MDSVAWETTCSVEAEASSIFAWNYWTNSCKGVENWNDPPAEFSLDGSFEEGARGTTRLPGSPPIHWVIRKCNSPVSATIEMQLDGATVSFEWCFEQIAGERVRLTQRVFLSGANAGDYIERVESAFKLNLADGMKKIAAAMELAANRKN
jgi:hypothetical protein